ncbi:MAG: hypothetical protein EOO00_09710 [Chitinophagaceae bacterium]|nr:MAG: hypothetical protein EOO00_09710 [Chitinophagaceae bacterium]
MTLRFRVTAEDLLTNQLYYASTSERIRKKRKRNRIMVPLFYLIIAAISFTLAQPFLSIAFLVIGVLWYLFYPLRERRIYIRHFRNYVAERMKDVNDQYATFQITDGHIIGQDGSTEIKMATSEILRIVELPTLILLRLKGGQSIIFPKAQLENIDIVRDRLKALADKMNVRYEPEPDWVWK